MIQILAKRSGLFSSCVTICDMIRVFIFYPLIRLLISILTRIGIVKLRRQSVNIGLMIQTLSGDDLLNGMIILGKKPLQ